MRHYQRGIGTVIILVLFLIVGVAIASAVFVFDQNQKSASVNSFEDCSKLYPVMESYPEQCNTSDGKHFVRELSEEEKQRLVPPTQPSASIPGMQACTMEAKICPDGSSVGRTGPNCEFAACPGETTETSDWKIYTSQKYKYMLSYPQNVPLQDYSTDGSVMEINNQFGFIAQSSPIWNDTSDYKDEIIGSYKGKSKSGFSEAGVGGRGVPQSYYSFLFDKNGIYYQFTLWELQSGESDDVYREPKSISSEDRKLFNQIIENFKVSN